MKNMMSIFSSCLISLFFAVLFSPAQSHAITIEAFTDWTLTINDKVINPDADPRAEAKRAFGPDADNAPISPPNLTADPLKIKASAKVTNTDKEATGVTASTSLNFSRIYKTKRLGSAGFFDVNVNGAVQGVMGTLTTDNPFFFPVAFFNLEIQVNPVDALGNVLGGPFAPAVSLSDLQGPVDTLGTDAWTGTPPNQGRKVTEIDSNFKTAVRLRKKQGVHTYFEVAGVLGVGASIKAVLSEQALDDYVAAFNDFLDEQIANPTATLNPEELVIAASTYINLQNGDLTAKGMSGFADSDFFGTIHLTVDATTVPEPSSWLLLGSGLAGLGFFRMRRKAA
jgi:hypothetical protein